MATLKQFKWRGNLYHIVFKPGFTLLCLFFFLLFCLLGNWQLHRYHFKKALLTAFQQRISGEPQPLGQLAPPMTNWQFQPVKVNADYLDDLTILLQNRYYHDRLGFEVLSPVKIAGEKKMLLVDRGWVPAGIGSSLPHVNTVKSNHLIVGHIKLLNEYQFILGENITDIRSRPLVLQKVDITELERVMHQTFYPFVLQLDTDQPNAFVHDWTTVTTIMPERHMGYAMQWFAMAAVLFIAYFFFCCERVKKREDEHEK